MGKFALFSTEMGPMLSPSVDDNLEKLFIFKNDPVGKGSYDPHVGTTARGSVITTLGGVVIQDFGPQIKDQRIVFSDEDALTYTEAMSLYDLYLLLSRELYFTDGYDCFLVQFSRPDGYVYRRNLVTSHFNVARYSYTIKLIVKAHENV